MPNSKMLLKIVLALGVWSFLIIALMKLQGYIEIPAIRPEPVAPASDQLMMHQNDDQTDRVESKEVIKKPVFSDDVLDDKRPGKYM